MESSNSNLNGPYDVDAFKTALRSFFGGRASDFQIEDSLRTQFKEFLASKGVNAMDLLNQAVIHRVVNAYGVLRMKENELNALKENGSQLHDEILHEHQIKSSVKMQSQDIQINPVQAMDDNLIVSKSSLIKPENNNAFSKSEIETQMQRQEQKADMREAVDAGLVVTESSGKKPDKQDISSSSGNYITQAVDADIGPVNDEEPFAEVQLTALHNILANEQQHTEQSEPNYDTHLLETIDSNTTPTSTNMCHRGGKIDQDALVNAELLKTKDMVCMEVYNELSKRFLQLEKHCISLEISIQQKEESFHSNKPCKNKEYPEFREFFVINELKAQLQAKTTLICDLKNQIKSVKEASNEAKVKNDIDVIETINIELEHSVAKLLAANEQLHKEKEHLKQTYKELYDTIKKTRVQNKDNSDSLISQINQKSVENADLKAQIQEKVNSRAKVQSPKIRNNNPLTKEPKLINLVDRFFKTVSLRWIPTGKMFTDSTTKVDSEPPNKLQKNPILHISVDISRTQTSLGHSLHQQIPFVRAFTAIQLVWNTLTHGCKRSLLHDNVVPKPDLALELGKSISLTKAEEEVVAKKLLQEKFMLLMQELCLNLNPSPHKEDSLNSMAEQNVPAQPPTRTDEQIVPRSQWLIIGKSNLLFNAQKIQKNPIFQISVDILNNTNFFRAFTASASVPAIYMQQFWNTTKYDKKTGVYSCQVDEHWLNLSVDLLQTSGSDKPRHPVLQMLWGIVTQTNVDHAELLWEEFTQGI
ncbi:hypothetical protein Tco_1172778 [Tanacetum coccineum]